MGAQLTVRQKGLLELLRDGWELVEGNRIWYLWHPGKQHPPSGYQCIEKKTFDAIYGKGWLIECNHPNELRRRWCGKDLL